MMSACRICKHPVSSDAMACPACGAPYPARAEWDGYGFEYRSKATFLGLPLVHIAFKYRPNRVPVVARGVIAIGQFACGGFTLAQFGIGIISVSQFTIAGLALAQFALAYRLVAQMGIYVQEGAGQLVISLAALLEMLPW